MLPALLALRLPVVPTFPTLQLPTLLALRHPVVPAFPTLRLPMLRLPTRGPGLPVHEPP